VTLFPGHDIFEQLCINFTNERLAKGFVDVVFKREQAEYLSEGVPWEPIVYVNFN
jgi:myosin heavy subunit